jgi:hypothetical protein
MQQKSSARDYIKVELVRKLLKYLKFLPFVPPKDVIKAFQEIKALGINCKKFDQIFDVKSSNFLIFHLKSPFFQFHFFQCSLFYYNENINPCTTNRLLPKAHHYK